MEKNLTPEIRFRGFTEPWISRDFRNTFDMLKSNSLSRDYLNYDNGILRSVHYGDILIKYDEVLDANRDVIPYITDDEVAAKYKQHCLKNGDIIIADTAEDTTTGKCVEIRSIAESSVVSGLHTMPCRPKEEFSDGYLGYYLNSDAFHSQLLPIMQGTKVVSISKSAIADMLVRFPNTSNEQAKIGNFFNHIVEMLKIKREELEKLENVKRACMERMFPREGETTPQLRFKGFTDDWKEFVLDEVGFMTAGGTPSTFIDQYWNGDINWLQSGAIQNCFVFEDAVDRKITQKGLVNSSTYMIRKDSVLIAITGATCANIGYLTFDSCANQSVVSIEPNSKHDSMFIYQILLTKRNDILALRGGSAQGGVSLGNLKSVKIYAPSTAEQKKIGSYFRHLDELIAAKRQEIEKLQNIKQSLLDKMFV